MNNSIKFTIKIAGQVDSTFDVHQLYGADVHQLYDAIFKFWETEDCSTAAIERKMLHEYGIALDINFYTGVTVDAPSKEHITLFLINES